jgi:hypothetical protein
MDFSHLDATLAETGQIDFSALGAVPAVGQDGQEDETTALGAAGRGAVGMIPLGEQAYSAISGATDKTPYLAARQKLEKEIEADKADHPVARTVGQAAGIAAPALLTGGASAPATLAEAAGEGAMVGAGFGAGNAIDTLASGGSGAKAAGDVALGTALGAGGGTLGHKIAGMAEEAVPGIENYAAKKAAQGVGLGSDELGNMSQQELIDTGKMLMDKAIVKPGASTQEMFDVAKNLHEGYGEKIGQIGNKAKELGLTTDIKPLLTSLEEKFQAADALQNPDERKAAIFYKRGIADITTMARQNLPNTLADVQGAPIPNDITFDQLQRLKRSYGNSAFENGMVKNQAAADVYGQLNAGQKDIVKRVSGNPNLPADLKDAMAGYSKMYPVVSGLQDVLGRERAGNMPVKGFGMIGKMVGQLPGQDKPAINALTALGLLGAGHPMWAVGAATATLQNPRAMSSAAQGLARAIPEVGEKLPIVAGQIAAHEAPAPMMHHMMEKTVEHGVHHTAEHAIQQNMGETKPVHTNSATVPSPAKTPATTVNVNHPALAPWKQTFDKNAVNATDEGEKKKSQAVTDFILSQRDPAYAKAKQTASDQPTPESGQNPAEMAGIPAIPEPPKRYGQPFNPEMRDKLNEFMRKQKEHEDAQSR